MLIGIVLLFVSIVVTIFGFSTKGFCEALWVNIAIAAILAIAGFVCLLIL